jgi:hypothetical protein
MDPLWTRKAAMAIDRMTPSTSIGSARIAVWPMGRPRTQAMLFDSVSIQPKLYVTIKNLPIHVREPCCVVVVVVFCGPKSINKGFCGFPSIHVQIRVS